MPRFRRPRSPVHLARQLTGGLLAVLALALALWPRGEPVDAAPPEVPVVVAASDLVPGSVLGAGDLALVPLPATAVPDGVATDVDELTGAVLAGPLRRGEPVTDVRVVGPGLWSQVPPGQVAAPVRLADLAVASLLRPGDRVDVLATVDGGAADVVADGALVIGPPPRTPTDASAPGSSGSAGLVVLAVPSETAGRLAGAAAGATLTVTLGRP